ncbi:MAG: hypothetical protein JWO88_2162 [Frankiales bacterium]|jgi:hypothetical protein|nr:hypothetical protein [Frankiales bacterium]
MKLNPRLAPSVPPGPSALVITFPGLLAGEHELRDAYDRYRTVADSVSPDTVTTTDVLEARIALTRLLLADGWEPPAEVLVRLRLDEHLLTGGVLSAS